MPKERISIERLHDEVADLPESTIVCAAVIPKGIPVCLSYGNFVLERIHTNSGSDIDITDLLFSYVPRMIEDEYIRASCNGDFTIEGILWISKEHLIKVNDKLRSLGHRIYPDGKTAVTKFLERDTPIPFDDMLFVSPIWSVELIAESFFACHSEFLMTLRSDFALPTHLTTSVRAIDNVISFYEQLRQYSPDSGEHSTSQQTPDPESVIIYNDDITSLRDNPQGNITPRVIAEIELEKPRLTIEIDSIIVGPDRLGRMHPTVHLYETSIDENELVSISIPSIPDLLAANYKENDIVELNFTSYIPRLGKIIKSSRNNYIPNGLKEVNNKRCSACGTALMQSNNNLYCENPECEETNFNRLLYACRKDVLDLPLSKTDITYLLPRIFESAITPIVELLNTNIDMLSSVIGEEKALSFITSSGKRHLQLYGCGYSRTVQCVVQERFIDALSLRGLFRSDLKKLRIGLENNKWEWKDLPNLLTDPYELCKLFISPQDSNTIVRSAKNRIEEVIAFSVL